MHYPVYAFNSAQGSGASGRRIRVSHSLRGEFVPLGQHDVTTPHASDVGHEWPSFSRRVHHVRASMT